MMARIDATGKAWLSRTRNGLPSRALVRISDDYLILVKVLLSSMTIEDIFYCYRRFGVRSNGQVKWLRRLDSFLRNWS